MFATAKREASGVRITAALLASCALIAFLRALVHLAAIGADLIHASKPASQNVVESLLFLGLTYALVKIVSGLTDLERWARNAAQMWGVVLLIWVMKTLIFPDTYNPKAPDADELVGLFVIYFAVVGIWLITFLSVPGVRKKFLSSRAAA